MTTETMELKGITEINLDDISEPTEPCRMADEELNLLKESIENHGLLAPITVTPNGSGYKILSGRNRFEAFKRLEDKHSIQAIVRDFTDTDFGSDLQRLITIDENICRKDLPALELAEVLVEKEKIYKDPHSKTASEAASSKDPFNGSLRVKCFLDATSEQTGKSRSSIHDFVSIGKKIISEVKETLSDSPLKSRKNDLLAISKLTEDDQKKVAEAIRVHNCSNLAEVKKHVDLTSKKSSKSTKAKNKDQSIKPSKVEQYFKKLEKHSKSLAKEYWGDDSAVQINFHVDNDAVYQSSFEIVFRMEDDQLFSSDEFENDESQSKVEVLFS